MNDQDTRETAAKIAQLFPNVNPAITAAITQELFNGVYDPFRVMVWANERRAETSLFNLDELRRNFINDQPRIGSMAAADAASQRYRDQVKQNQLSFERSKPESTRKEQFFAQCSPEELADLKSEFLATAPPEIVRMKQGDEVRTSPYLRAMIWGMVNQRKGAVA